LRQYQFQSHSLSLYIPYKKPPQIFCTVRRGLTTRQIKLTSLSRRQPINHHRLLSHKTLGLVECRK